MVNPASWLKRRKSSWDDIREDALVQMFVVAEGILYSFEIWEI